jgi:hypothetical protein
MCLVGMDSNVPPWCVLGLPVVRWLQLAIVSESPLVVWWVPGSTVAAKLALFSVVVGCGVNRSSALCVYVSR